VGRSEAARVVPECIIIHLASPRKGLNGLIEEERLCVPYGVELGGVSETFTILDMRYIARSNIEQ
jgi:hypothetical protein